MVDALLDDQPATTSAPGLESGTDAATRDIRHSSSQQIDHGEHVRSITTQPAATSTPDQVQTAVVTPNRAVQEEHPSTAVTAGNLDPRASSSSSSAPPNSSLAPSATSASTSFEPAPTVSRTSEPTLHEELPAPPTPVKDEPQHHVELESSSNSGSAPQRQVPAPAVDISSTAAPSESSPSITTRDEAPHPPIADSSDSGLAPTRRVESSSTAPTSHAPPYPASAELDSVNPLSAHAPARRHQDAQQEEQWLLKTIAWPPLPAPPSGSGSDPESTPHPAGGRASPTTIKIICQNLNGPCSFIALCNVLLLRHSITLPSSLDRVSYSYLSSLLADYLLSRGSSSSEDTSLSLTSALSTLPSTRYGLELNPRFGSTDGFTPSPAVSLFQAFDIPLLHGWCVDPDEKSGETWQVVVEGGEDYDTVVERIVRGRELSGGQLEGETTNEARRNDDELVRALERSSKWTEQEAKAVREAHLLHSFLSSTSTQLTYHGLVLLSSSLAPSSLSTLFRNSHVSVLYRRPNQPDPLLESTLPRLFTLVTDSAFVQEPEIVWESLQDVDGAASEFYDGRLRKSHPRGGDWVGRSTGATMRRSSEGHEREEEADGDRGVEVGGDEELARQLQFEEERQERRLRTEEQQQREQSERIEWDRIQREQQEQRQQQQTLEAELKGQEEMMGKKGRKKDKKKDKDCLIM